MCKIILILILFTIGSCSHKVISPDENIDLAWVSSPTVADDELIDKKEAIEFTNDFFSLLDQVIFDPTFKKKERSSIQAITIDELSKTASITRIGTARILNHNLKSLGISHLLSLNSAKTKMILQMTGADSKTLPAETIKAKLKGEFGIIRVPTFLVPGITNKQVLEARSKLKKAKYIIYDLRDNGGGSASSVSYLIEPILGPNKVIQYSKTRAGIHTNEPYVLDRPFEDAKNFGSEADINFEKEKKFIEWRTSQEAVKDNRLTIVVVNKNCASSADIFPMAIKEHRAAILVGTKTSGQVLGGILFKLPWKGYSALMPVSQVISPKGKLYEGVGISPDIEIPSCDKPDDKCISKVMSLVKSGSIKHPQQ